MVTQNMLKVTQSLPVQAYLIDRERHKYMRPQCHYKHTHNVYIYIYLKTHQYLYGVSTVAFEAGGDPSDGLFAHKALRIVLEVVAPILHGHTDNPGAKLCAKSLQR